MKPALAAVASLALAAAAANAQTVRPTSATVPANLLRLSIAFDDPPARPVLSRLALRLEDGSIIDEPFLDQELWSPDGRILTVLMHPGRVKTGLAASERLGRALVAGETVTITLDGRAMRTWTVTAPDVSPPSPARWTIDGAPSAAGGILTVRLDGQVDAFDGDLIAVRGPDGSRVPGQGTLTEGETVWRFTPERPWTPGHYAVVAAPMLEDPSGNRPGSAFEHPPGAEDGLAPGPAFDVRQLRRQPSQDRTKP